MTLSDHFTFMILRRHLFTNVCILLTVCLVIIHDSEVCNRTDLTLELNILILVFNLISVDVHIFLRMRKATGAFGIRALVSSPHASCIVYFTVNICETVCFPPLVLRVSLYYISIVHIVCADTTFRRSVFYCNCS